MNDTKNNERVSVMILKSIGNNRCATEYHLLLALYVSEFAEEMKKEVERFRHETSEHARLQKIEIERPKIALMKNVMKDQFVDEELIGKVMSREWAIIKDSGILDNMVPDHDQQEEIKLFFTANFVELTDMYKFYSAVNSGGGTHTLEYIELCKFITETGILGEEHSNTILKVFLESHIRGLGGRDPKVKPSIHSEICQTEFFVALIKISVSFHMTMYLIQCVSSICKSNAKDTSH